MKDLTKITLISLVTLTILSLEAWATCSTDIDINNNNLINVADPVNAQDVATKAYVDALRAKFPTQRYIRDNNKEIVTDNKTGLMWQDNADVDDMTKRKPWLTYTDHAICMERTDLSICQNNPPKEGTAQSYCFALTLGGYGDWRLPTIDELLGIVKKDVEGTPIDDVFKHTASALYISSTYEDIYIWTFWPYYTNEIASVAFINEGYGTVSGSEDYLYYVRCVRNGQ